MSRLISALAIVAVLTMADRSFAQLSPSTLALGRPATAEDIDVWDIDVRPDGQGLRVGHGTPGSGRPIFEQRCAVCHGMQGTDAKEAPKLAGGIGELQSDQPKKTVGSYWPFATTLYDYIYRAMPVGHSKSLSVDETYAVTAYVLYLNGVIKNERFILDQVSLPKVQMPNRKGFDKDDRRRTEAVFWPSKRCTENCREPPVVESVAELKK